MDAAWESPFSVSQSNLSTDALKCSPLTKNHPHFENLKMAEAVKQLGCSGLNDLLEMIEENKQVKNIYILCSGAVGESGESWCPDCVKGNNIQATS